jgi:hypothetical protein
MFTPKVIILGGIVVFAALSLALKENYPLSHYPMYGDPDPVSQYYHLTDGQGKPLPINQLTGVRAANLGKILRKRLNDRAKDMKINVKSLPPAERDRTSQETLEYLRSQAKHHKQVIPDKLRIMFTTIRFHEGHVLEQPEVFYAE